MGVKFLAIGKVVNTFGLKGEVKLLLFPEFRFCSENSPTLLFYQEDNHFQPLQLESVRLQKKHYLLKFQSLNGVGEVNFLKNQFLFATDQQQTFVKEQLWTKYHVRIDNQVYSILAFFNNGRYDLIQINHQKLIWIPVIPPYLIAIDKDKWELEIDLGGLE